MTACEHNDELNQKHSLADARRQRETFDFFFQKVQSFGIERVNVFPLNMFSISLIKSGIEVVS